jgi:hypothetical protein
MKNQYALRVFQIDKRKSRKKDEAPPRREVLLYLITNNKLLYPIQSLTDSVLAGSIGEPDIIPSPWSKGRPGSCGNEGLFEKPLGEQISSPKP